MSLHSSWDLAQIRKDFPILSRKVHEKPLVYLDNGATLQKPKTVIDAITNFYTQSNANVHRGVHYLSQIATDAYEGVRPKLCRFLGTKNEKEIIFTRGTTEAVNLVTQSLSSPSLKNQISTGDTLAVTRMEHHSNFVPWQQLARLKNAHFEIIELNEDRRISSDSLRTVLEKKPKVLSLTLMSNVSGVINDVASIAKALKEKSPGSLIFVDAAQGAAHFPISIPALGPIDFLAFSSHKLGGPTGVGVLWGRESVLKSLPPYQFGGDMISQVSDQESTWNELPWKFEAGTPNIADVVGLGAAIDYLSELGMQNIEAYEKSLTQYALDALLKIDGLTLFGPKKSENRGAVFSFVFEGVHPHDLATFLDVEGIAVRAGHHCAQPLLKHSQIPALTRASFSFYNTPAEVDHLAQVLIQARQYFSKKGGTSHVSK